MSRVNGRGLFLDLDGTIADSLGLMRLVFDRFLAAHGRTGSEESFNALNGPPLAVVVERIREDFALPGTQEELLEAYQALLLAAYVDVQPMAGAARLLREAKALGWSAALVTSTRTALAEQWLARSGLAGQVDAVVGGDQCKVGKPAAEPYILALQRTGCRPELSLAVEDSLEGMRAAIGAGIRTLFLAPTEDPEIGLPSVTVIRSLDDVWPHL